MLLLSVIMDLLDRHNYSRAFTMMRSQRVDLNLLYDHNPTEFLSVRAPAILFKSVGYFGLMPIQFSLHKREWKTSLDKFSMLIT